MILKKILILNETAAGYGTSSVRGMVNLEKTDARVKCSLTVFNLSDLHEGEFIFAIASDNIAMQHKPVGSTGKVSYTFLLSPDMMIDGKLSAVLLHMHKSKITPVLYGANFPGRIWESPLLERLKKRMGAQEQVRNEELGARSEGQIANNNNEPNLSSVIYHRSSDHNSSPTPHSSLNYNDEAIATENYYGDFAEAAAADIPEQGISGQSGAGNGQKPGEKPGPAIYYQTVRPNIETLFKSNPPETALNDTLKGTRWIRIKYDEKQYYIVGLIGDAPDYIGYGVPGKYSVNPPVELSSYCQWLPLNEDDPRGAGYWMMYQNARTGESIKLDIM
ncbi:MAG: hypothetical protein FWE62_04750 [Firmicutes bacterium]|nr:hypothetical protein [Bacillota bacterium]